MNAEAGQRGMRLHAGQRVTVVPDEDQDPYILQFQRYATVSRCTDAGYFVRLHCTVPPDREFGPIPPSRLLPDWKVDGRWRSW